MKSHALIKYLALPCILPTVALVAGCASPSHGFRVSTPIAIGMHETDHLSVTVTHSAEDPSTADERNRLVDETRRALEQIDRIVDLVEVTNREAARGMLVELSVAKLRRVSEARRLWLAAMAGRASIEVHVRLCNPKTGAELGAACITGASSGGHIFAGTTDEAIEEAGKAVAEFVGSQR